MLEKISRIQEKIGKLQKNTQGYNYKFFDINQLLEKLQPLLREEGLVITQPIKSIVSFHEGNESRHHVLKTIITDIETKEEISSSLPLSENVKPQDLGSAITYYRRYSLVSLLALEAEDDDGKKAQESSTGLSKVAFDRLEKVYKETGVMTPDMQEYYNKCNAEQKKIISGITKELRK